MANKIQAWAELGRRAKDLFQDIKAEVADMSQGAQERAPKLWQAAKQQGSKTWSDATVRGEKLYKSGEKAVRKSPGSSLGIALLIAGALGYLLFKSSAESEEDYPNFN